MQNSEFRFVKCYDLIKLFSNFFSILVLNLKFFDKVMLGMIRLLFM